MAEADAKTDEVKKQVEADIAKAEAWQIDDQDIVKARKLIGIDVAYGQDEQSWNGDASAAGIKRWTYSIGDDNPLYWDANYAAGTRWGGLVAPGSMAQILHSGMLGDPMDPALAKETRSLFRGIHVFVAGADKYWYKPIFEGDVLRSYGGADAIEEKPSEFAGRSIIRYNRRVSLNQRGEIVYIARGRAIHTERKAAAQKGKYTALEPAVYTDEDIAKIDEIYANEKPRGGEPRYFEDVEIGDKMPTYCKGPLTVTEVIVFHGGGYGVTDGYRIGGSREWHKNRKRIRNFYIKDEAGVPDVSQRVHWNNDWARKIGNPMSYDYSVMRESWLHHYLTDWVGDDGFVHRQYDEVRKFNYMGDTQFLSGQVVAKREEEGRFYVDLMVQMTNQRGTVTTLCEATVLLPSKKHGPVVLPEPSTAEKVKATKMWSRHNEIAREKGFKKVLT
ncbi:MAG: MaoC family dehydratase N-terminal domain-containing protein [Caulobacterales bacterium]